jgi:leucine dehydrogenase
MLLDFADTVDVLEGHYVTAEDVGTGSRDMSVIGSVTRHVTGLSRPRGGSGDPSPFTALGVEAAMRAACERAFGSSALKGRTVAVVGAGRVGSRLARRLKRAGARLLIADIDESKRSLARELRAKWTDSDTALLADVDVLAPCALGGVVNEYTAGRLRCRVVCGAANNQLAHEGLADDLHAHGILYAPDFIANAGGIINISVELGSGRYDPSRARRSVIGIEATMSEVFDEAGRTGVVPLAAAYALARRRLADAGQEPR